jgi:glucokinase
MVEYLQRIGKPEPSSAAIAIANPVLGDHVQMTNHTWSFSIAEMQRSFHFRHFVVINDFKAIALSLPSLSDNDVRRIGGGELRPDGPRAVIGPGTGLGVAGLLADSRGGWVAVEGEGGHATLAACTSREWSVIEWLTRHYGHASAERAVSGQGLADIHRALVEIDRREAPDRDAAQVSRAALEEHDPVAIEALELFCAFLGTVAGNLALTLGSTGGVYIGGGIVPRLGSFFDASPFRRRFEAKGRFSAYAARIPTWVIVRDTSPALLGAERALDAAIAASAS